MHGPFTLKVSAEHLSKVLLHGSSSLGAYTCKFREKIKDTHHSDVVLNWVPFGFQIEIDFTWFPYASPNARLMWSRVASMDEQLVDMVAV